MTMNRPVGNPDVAHATKLAALRPDLAALQAEVGTSVPAGAVAEIQKVKNDVRLPSQAMHAALLAADAQPPAAAQPAAGGPRSIETQWSVAARAIGAVLADLQAEPEPVRGSAPLWASAQKAPSAPMLAAALDKALSGSGLFYESHLLEFAMGLRSVAQLADEPQMRLTQQQLHLQQPESGGAKPQPPALQAAQAPPATAAAAAAAAVAQAPALPGAAATAVPSGAAPRGDLAQPPAPPVLAPNQAPGMPTHLAALPAGDAPGLPGERAAADAGASSARAAAAAPALEVIHPQTTALVHQQLDLLATTVFRWTGQAWPDVPMTWSVEPEHESPANEAEARGANEAQAPRRWVTTVSLVLPRLGAVDLRLSLMGEQVQAQLAASEAGTLARLQGGGGELGPRLEAAGLRLQDLQITAMPAEAELHQ
jgi:hypothetical protein